ncbi:MAG: hypothetical protein QOH57_2903, partial [Mycobacterium sp.]|nr:hypothetical protein [Mycobacterium sp.]
MASETSLQPATEISGKYHGDDD